MRKKLIYILLLAIFSLFQDAAIAQVKKNGKILNAEKTANKKSLLQSIDRGKVVYATRCLACHQANGTGVPNMNPPLTKNKWTVGSKTILINMILKGSHGTVEIDGDTFHNNMPAQPQLTDQQIADVLSYVRNNFGNKASAVSVAEIKSIRSKQIKPTIKH